MKRRRRRRARSRPQTLEDFDRLLAGEGMPAELPALPWNRSRRARRGAKLTERTLSGTVLRGHTTRAFYDRARDLLNSGDLHGEALKVWKAVCEGLGERRIARLVGRTPRYNYNWYLGPFRNFLGLPTRAFRVPTHRRPRRKKGGVRATPRTRVRTP